MNRTPMPTEAKGRKAGNAGGDAAAIVRVSVLLRDSVKGRDEYPICPLIAELRRQMVERMRLAWASYETMKFDWLAAHPKATPDEVAAACREIADTLGL